MVNLFVVFFNGLVSWIKSILSYTTFLLLFYFYNLSLFLSRKPLPKIYDLDLFDKPYMCLFINKGISDLIFLGLKTTFVILVFTF